jgi:hypothetical protein
MEFEENYWWDSKFSGLKFVGSTDGKRYVFAVSRTALVDFFQTVDTPEQAILNFEENRARFESMVQRFVTGERFPHDDGPIVVTFLRCIEYQL